MKLLSTFLKACAAEEIANLKTAGQPKKNSPNSGNTSIATRDEAAKKLNVNKDTISDIRWLKKNCPESKINFPLTGESCLPLCEQLTC